jgi:hypothetical protein
MKHCCPYCFTETKTRQGLHSHLIQKKACRENMEADVYISESASENSNENSNENPNSNSPTSQHANEMDFDNEMDFEGPIQHLNPIPDVQVATAPSQASSPQQPQDISPNEEVDHDVEDADDNETRWIEEYPYPAGVPIGEGISCFEEWRRDQKKKNQPPWSPFENREEWELVQWLITSGISQKKMDAFLKLNMVRVSRNIINMLLTIEI